MSIDIQQLNQLFSSFSTPPFLFVGSGMSQRYLGTSDWRGLLRTMANFVSDDAYGFSAYMNRCTVSKDDDMYLPALASAIERDYNDKWYTSSSPKWRERREEFTADGMPDGLSPFKFHISKMFSNCGDTSALPRKLQEELEVLKELAARQVGGIITTNYDCLLETLFADFTTYVGQSDMIYSNIQGVGEIYKIHGCCKKPDSIIINQDDYEFFDSKKTYLAAKLLTIFIERPIIFMGYSLNDRNIKTIMNTIVGGFEEQQIRKLEGRLIYINYIDCTSDERIYPTSREYTNGRVQMTQIDLCDYKPLFDSMKSGRYQYSTKLLKHMKEQVSELIRTSTPSSSIIVIDIADSANLDRVEFVAGVGIITELASKGIVGLSARDVYSDIINDSLSKRTGFNIQFFVDNKLPELVARDTTPVWKYISKLPEGHVLPECISAYIRRHSSIDGFRTATIRKGIRGTSEKISRWRSAGVTIKKLRGEYRTASQCMPHVLYLRDDCINKDDLYDLLLEVITEKPDILTTTCSEFRKLVRVYDFLRYGKM